MKKLPEITQDFVKKAWSIKDLETKRKFVLDFIGDDFNKISEYKLRENIIKSRSSNQIDMIISNMLLKSEFKSVLKI